MDLRELVRSRWARGERVDYLICDEAQFYTVEQVEQMADLVDCSSVDVYAFGLATDFRSELFPAARAAVRAGRRAAPAPGRGAVLVRPVRAAQRPRRRRRGGPRGRPGRGRRHRPDEVEVRYQVLCRQHYRAGDLGPADTVTGQLRLP